MVLLLLFIRDVHVRHVNIVMYHLNYIFGMQSETPICIMYKYMCQGAGVGGGACLYVYIKQILISATLTK